MESNIAYVVGAIANIAFGMKSLPQVVKCYKSKSTAGLSLPMLLLDFLGNIGCTYYIYATVKFAVYFQYVNYFLASLWLVILFVMMRKYKTPKRKFTIRVDSI
jgi:uncharacterized protein with PQ loop repeat